VDPGPEGAPGGQGCPAKNKGQGQYCPIVAETERGNQDRFWQKGKKKTSYGSLHFLGKFDEEICPLVAYGMSFFTQTTGPSHVRVLGFSTPTSPFTGAGALLWSWESVHHLLEDIVERLLVGMKKGRFIIAPSHQ